MSAHKRAGKIAGLALSNLFKKPDTVAYPANKVGLSPDIRGLLSFDKEQCIGCHACMRDCPTGAITIEKIGEKQFRALFDKGKCVYCGQCVDSCNKGALGYTPEFELAGLQRDDMRIELDKSTAGS